MHGHRIGHVRESSVDQNPERHLRNQIAHGLMRYEQFFHYAPIYAWFIFQLTIFRFGNDS